MKPRAVSPCANEEWMCPWMCKCMDPVNQRISATETVRDLMKM